MLEYVLLDILYYIIGIGKQGFVRFLIQYFNLVQNKVSDFCFLYNILLSMYLKVIFSGLFYYMDINIYVGYMIYYCFGIKYQSLRS